MPSCAVSTCKNYNQNTKGTDIKYFRLPKNEDLAKQWVVACRREDKINLKNACVCSVHFEINAFEIPLQQRLLQYTPRNSRHLKPDALPTVNLPGVPKISQNNEERSLRLTKRRRREEVKDIVNTSISTESQSQSQTLNNKTIPEENVLNLANNINTELDNIEHKLPESRVEPNQSEVYVSNKIEIDKKQEQTVGPHKACQVQFDQPMLKEILEQIISELFGAGYIVVAICSDMGTGNISLWNKLSVGHNKNCYFSHPCDDSLKIFVYADVPHLIKRMRNHLIDHGINIEGSIINVDYLEALLNISTSELTLAHKLAQQHLHLKGSMRQRVRPAVQVFSNSVAKAITYCGEHELMPKNSDWKKAAELVQLLNDWLIY